MYNPLGAGKWRVWTHGRHKGRAPMSQHSLWPCIALNWRPFACEANVIANYTMDALAHQTLQLGPRSRLEMAPSRLSI